ncbi:2-polyprenyl-6-methoxyphenol hydroxylase-like FAD-dependent oxidoreductase [Agromyces flavus]|uniref:2-polyprenyl-6-methoxyphenol hydroxylase n=1 Tax=Agromyces flavus TaxID=589382 RepID=A0A1H1LB03_9MICO|nr:flavin-dependent oxidoreductase [Agromyces flavus]MCP2367501.1 2-polyprenyl-6-methoxyphenol hydroxylase-like FAD-dependent oxidoreductase [Agromyces flavus]GGI45605.1 flavin-dependent oxidoreductase [Agromyces flavus]SDR71734.1 2-polyprenyl-6-methoxyphenol hydroxylase [Agromyces flavus]
MRIVIVGAGIGGLVTALSLEAAGFRDIRVVERVRELRPLGVGINLLPHAVRELTELGLAELVAGIGVAPSRLAYFNRHGQPIWSEPRGLDAGYHWPQLSVHRGEFQMLLLREVERRLGVGTVQQGLRLASVDDGDPDVATARFVDAAGDDVVLEADVLVGADGIHSALRAQRYPDEGAPPWNGLILWRGTAIVPEYLDGRTMIMAGDGEQKFVAYPLSAPDAAAGMSRVNFIAERRAPEGATALSDWNRPVDPEPIVELFAGWRFDWLDVPLVIASAEGILEYPMVDRDPIPSWTSGRTILLGDAAHAMYPNGSNGASQAILDARTLAHRIATEPSVEAALAAYEADRRPATARLLEMTRRLGPEQVMQLAYERAPQGFADVHDVIPRDELERIARDYKVAAGFDPAGLNERSSLSVPTVAAPERA